MSEENHIEYAVYHGKPGYGTGEQQRESAKVFEVGKQYKIIGGEMYAYHTDIILEGVDGRWNSVLFDFDYSKAPLKHLYR